MRNPLESGGIRAGVLLRAALLDLEILSDAFQIADDIDGSEDLGGFTDCG